MKIKWKKLLFWGVILAFFGSIFIRQQITIEGLHDKHKQYEEQLSHLQEKNAKLTSQLEQTQTDDYIEKMAREKLGLIKPGEILFIDKDKNNN